MPRRPTVRRPPDSPPTASPTTTLPPPTASAPPASERVSASAHALPLSQQRHCQTRLPSAPTPPQDPALLVYIPQERSTNCRARSYFHCAPMSPTRPTMSCSCNNKTNVVSDYFSNRINRSSSNRAGCRTLANCCPCSRNCVCSRT